MTERPIFRAFPLAFLLAAIVMGCAPSTAPSPKVPYHVVHSWKIPNGGYGELVVISPAYRNESDMRALGAELKRVRANERNSFITIYDDAVAAQLRILHQNSSFDEWAEADLVAEQAHRVGAYTKNANTGFHVFEIFLQGFDGPVMTVNY